MRDEVRTTRKSRKPLWTAAAAVAALSLAACGDADDPAEAPAANQAATNTAGAVRDTGSDAADEYEAMRRAGTLPADAAGGASDATRNAASDAAN